MSNFVYRCTCVSVYYLGSTLVQTVNSVYLTLKIDRVAVSVILTNYKIVTITKSPDRQITDNTDKTFPSKKVF